jgi:hypothetical protein
MAPCNTLLQLGRVKKTPPKLTLHLFGEGFPVTMSKRGVCPPVGSHGQGGRARGSSCFEHGWWLAALGVGSRFWAWDCIMM